MSRSRRRKGSFLVLSGLVIGTIGARVLPILNLFLALFLVEKGSKYLTVGAKLAIPDARLAMHDDHRPPVLYLRSFHKDSYREPRGIVSRLFFFCMGPMLSEIHGSSTLEQSLAGPLWKLGPFVAIGGPRERVPQIGAARMYVSSARWQSEVATLMDESCLVLFWAGDSEGLKWEFQTMVKRVPPEKIVILLAPHAGLSAWAQSLLPSYVPTISHSRTTRFVHFDAVWTPHYARRITDVISAKGLIK